MTPEQLLLERLTRRHRHEDRIELLVRVCLALAVIAAVTMLCGRMP